MSKFSDFVYMDSAFRPIKIDAEGMIARFLGVVAPPEARPPAIDYAVLAIALRRTGQGHPAALVEYMQDRKDAPFGDVKHPVHGDKDVSDEAVRKNVCLTNRLLIELGSPLKFSTSCGLVCKSIRPLVSPQSIGPPVTPGNEDVTDT